MHTRLLLLLSLTSACLLLVAVAAACGGDDDAEPLKLGLILAYGDDPSENALGRQRSVELAIRHVNEAGGVFGQPVELAIGDSFHPDGPAAEARRLIEEEGVHAFVGPTGSSHVLAAIEVAAAAGIPIVSPSATSPLLTTADDNDFLFRTVISDVAQGPVMAQLAQARDYERIGLIYRNDAWGQGLSGAFAEAWPGDLVAVAIEPGEESYLDALEQSVSGDPDALVLLTFGAEGEVVLREAIENGLYDQFIFGDGLRRPEIVAAIGAEHLGGMYGVAGTHEAGTASESAWEAAASGEDANLPNLTYVREIYDAAIAVMLAAIAADSADGADIRDQLRTIGSAPGRIVIAGPEGIAEAIRSLEDGDAINYEGAAGSLDWDEYGDLRRGAVGIWRFTDDGDIEDLPLVIYER